MALFALRTPETPDSVPSYQGNNLTITKALLNVIADAKNSGNYDLSYQGNNLTITKALLT